MKKMLTVLGLMGIPAMYSMLVVTVPNVASVLIFIGFDLGGFMLLAMLGAAAGALAFGDIAFRSFLIAIL